MATAQEPLSSVRRDQLLMEAGLALASDLGVDEVLQKIVQLAVGITGATYGALGVIDDDGRIERFITEGVSDEVREQIGNPPVGHGILGILIREQRSLSLPDIGADPRSVGFPANHPPMRSFLGTPVSAFGQVFGNIYLTEKRGADRFSGDDLAALEVLAAQAGVAIENARLNAESQRAEEELRRLQVLEERERIAKELHDGVIQSLFAVGMRLQGTAAMAGNPELSDRIEGAVEEIDRAIRDLRNYIFGLRPGILADRQLDQALRELGAEFESRSRVVTVVEVDEHVAAELASVAADVVQLTREALSNVGRHAEAATCRVSLRRDGDAALLEIDDDGVGFDVETSGGGGMGLSNLRGRVDSMRGSFSLVSVPGEGTTLRVTLPLH